MDDDASAQRPDGHTQAGMTRRRVRREERIAGPAQVLVAVQWNRHPLALCRNGIEAEERIGRIRLDRPAGVGHDGDLQPIRIHDRNEPTRAQVESFPRRYLRRDRSSPCIGDGGPVVHERNVPEHCSWPLQLEHWLIRARPQIADHDRLGVPAADGQEAAIRTERQGASDISGGRHHVGQTAIRHAADA